MENVSNTKLAVIFAISGAVCYSLMALFVKIIGTAQSTTMVSFVRFAVGLVVLFPWFITDKELFISQNKVKILLRSITTLLNITCTFYALKFMPVANTLVLSNTYPLFLPIIVWILMGIKSPPKMWLGLILGFVGVAFVLQPHIKTFNWAALIALAAGLIAALSVLQVRLLSQQVTAQQILFYLFLFATIITGVLVPFSFKMPTMHMVILLLLVGVFGAFYQLFFTLALKYAIARIVSPLFFISILFAVFLDWLVWAKIPDLFAVIGMVLVIAGAIMTILFTKQADKEKAKSIIDAQEAMRHH